MNFIPGDLIRIKNHIEIGKIYGDIEADKDHVKIAGSIQFIKRIRDSLYSDGYIVDDGIIISEQMIDNKLKLRG